MNPSRYIIISTLPLIARDKRTYIHNLLNLLPKNISALSLSSPTTLGENMPMYVLRVMVCHIQRHTEVKPRAEYEKLFANKTWYQPYRLNKVSHDANQDRWHNGWCWDSQRCPCPEDRRRQKERKYLSRSPLKTPPGYEGDHQLLSEGLGESSDCTK